METGRGAYSWVMARSVRALGVVLLALLGACESPTTPDPLSEPCMQTYEFGNLGCARFVLVLPPEVQDVPTTLYWEAKWVSEGENQFTQMRFRGDPRSRILEIKRWHSRADGPLEIRIESVVYDADSAPEPPGGHFPVLAGDSASYPVSFTPVGSVPPADTIQLTAVSPEG